MDFDKKEFYGIVAKAKKQMQITIDQDCNVADTKPDVEKMIQTRGIVKIQETEMMVDRVRIKGEFVFQGLYGTNDTSAYLESLEYSLPFEEYVHIEGVLPSDYVKVKYTIDDINTILINSRKISIRVLLTFSFQITEEMKLAAAEAIAGLVSEDQLCDEFIMPEAFDPRVAEVVSEAVESHIK